MKKLISILAVLMISVGVGSALEVNVHEDSQLSDWNDYDHITSGTTINDNGTVTVNGESASSHYWRSPTNYDFQDANKVVIELEKVGDATFSFYEGTSTLQEVQLNSTTTTLSADNYPFSQMEKYKVGTSYDGSQETIVNSVSFKKDMPDYEPPKIENFTAFNNVDDSETLFYGDRLQAELTPVGTNLENLELKLNFENSTDVSNPYVNSGSSTGGGTPVYEDKGLPENITATVTDKYGNSTTETIFLDSLELSEWPTINAEPINSSQMFKNWIESKKGTEIVNDSLVFDEGGENVELNGFEAERFNQIEIEVSKDSESSLSYRFEAKDSFGETTDSKTRQLSNGSNTITEGEFWPENIQNYKLSIASESVTENETVSVESIDIEGTLEDTTIIGGGSGNGITGNFFTGFSNFFTGLFESILGVLGL